MFIFSLCELLLFFSKGTSLQNDREVSRSPQSAPQWNLLAYWLKFEFHPDLAQTSGF